MSVNVHASCIVLADAALRFRAPANAGVLLLGESGAGKSDTALRLIGLGARLVADDRAELFEREGRLWARATGSLAGLIEARGLGIIALPFEREAAVALAVHLVSRDDVPRMPQAQTYGNPAEPALATGHKPPLVTLSSTDPSTPDKIILAAAAFAHALFRS